MARVKRSIQPQTGYPAGLEPVAIKRIGRPPLDKSTNEKFTIALRELNFETQRGIPPPVYLEKALLRYGVSAKRKHNKRLIINLVRRFARDDHLPVTRGTRSGITAFSEVAKIMSMTSKNVETIFYEMEHLDQCGIRTTKVKSKT